MAYWTELLPDWVENPIVIEVRHPTSMRKNRDVDDRARAEMRDLANDRDYLDSHWKMVRELGADWLTILTVPMREHWELKEGTPGEASRKPGPPARDVYITVHLPPTVAKTPADVELATQTVMDWFESSKLGLIYLRAGRAQVGKLTHASARGVQYAEIADLGHIETREDIDENIEFPVV